MEGPEFENGCQSPRISFSLDLSHTDRTSTEQWKREEFADNTDFEFCIVSNNKDRRDEDFRKNLISADELFMDGKILPQIRPLEPHPVTSARHLSRENSSCPSGVRSASFSRPSGWWNEMFKLGNREYLCAKSEEAEEDTNESSNKEKQPRCLWPFSKSRRETRGNCLFSSLPFFRSKSAGEQKSKPAALYFRRSMSVGAQSGRKVTEPLLAGSDAAEAEDLTKSRDFLPKRKGRNLRTTGEEMGSPGRVGRGNDRFTVRNLERCSTMPWNSQRPMAERLVNRNSNLGMSMSVNPVLNLCNFGTFFYKTESKRSPHFAGSINRNMATDFIYNKRV